MQLALNIHPSFLRSGDNHALMATESGAGKVCARVLRRGSRLSSRGLHYAINFISKHYVLHLHAPFRTLASLSDRGRHRPAGPAAQ